MLLRAADAFMIKSSRSGRGGAACHEVSALAIAFESDDAQPRSSRGFRRVFDATSLFEGILAALFAAALLAILCRSSLLARKTGPSFFSAEANITPACGPRSRLPSL